MAKLKKIVKEADTLLRTSEIGDSPRAYNGLQLENSGAIKRIVAAVDACEATLAAAAEKPGTLLLVHHGLFWVPPAPVTGSVYRKLKLAIDNDLAVYSAHLPLDHHPKIGNSFLLAKAIGIAKPQPFLKYEGSTVGFRGSMQISRNALIERVEGAVGGPVHLAPGGPAKVRKIGVVTGGAGSEVAAIAAEGVDTFITGEGPHWSYTLAEELGINLLYAGHYATETFGVKALAEYLAGEFKLKWSFFDHPTRL